MSQLYYGLLRVRVESDGRLMPISYGVGDDADFNQATVVGHEYTIAICALPTRSLEEARRQLKENLRWFEPLLVGAEPNAWFASEDPA